MSELETIAARLENLEKQNRRWKLLACGAVLIACIPVVLGAAKPSRTIQAERFEVVDGHGNVRAVLGTRSDDESIFQLHSKHQSSFFAWASEEGAGMTLTQNARNLPPEIKSNPFACSVSVPTRRVVLSTS